MNITLELYGLSGQAVQAELLRVQDGVAIVVGYASPEEGYRLSDGRRVENGKPTSWDFWRLSESDRSRLGGEVEG